MRWRCQGSVTARMNRDVRMQRNAGATSAAEQTLPIGGARALVRPCPRCSRREGSLRRPPQSAARCLLTSLDRGAGGTSAAPRCRVEAQAAARRGGGRPSQRSRRRDGLARDGRRGSRTLVPVINYSTLPAVAALPRPCPAFTAAARRATRAFGIRRIRQPLSRSSAVRRVAGGTADCPRTRAPSSSGRASGAPVRLASIIGGVGVVSDGACPTRARGCLPRRRAFGWGERAAGGVASDDGGRGAWIRSGHGDQG